jgi:hypothetical protein
MVQPQTVNRYEQDVGSPQGVHPVAIFVNSVQRKVLHAGPDCRVSVVAVSWPSQDTPVSVSVEIPRVCHHEH